jgi:hypothetical protein
MKKTILLLSSLLQVTPFFCNAQNESTGYKIANKFSVDGDGKWDYLTMDENTGRLFVSHGNITQVVDRHHCQQFPS